MWQLWSIRLAAVAGLLTTAITGNQTLALGLIYFLPDGVWRWVAAAGCGLLVFGIPALARLLAQSKLQEKRDAAKSE